ncbi:nitroreductase family protein [Bacillus massiliigorillae]|uniref:nitroreductase family protein n=1 Tax=Bacillus massiliigorillae TaxID=1243664 RepID=UPI00039A5B33|nr:nitroreductase family protein [Bacillus massiliigorillae]
MSNTTKSLSEIIHARHSVRKFDSSFSISKEEIENILSEATSAPSSSNLQPWKFIVIQDAEVKKELRAIAYNQEQVETASAVIAVLGDTEMYRNAEQVHQSSLEVGFIDEDRKKLLIDNVNKAYPYAPFEARANIATFDAGLISMQLMLIAKEKGYDTVTMGGFDKQKLIEKFNINERYIPIVLIALGKAAAPAYKTTRLPIEQLVQFV